MCFRVQSHSVAQAGLDLPILLPQSLSNARITSMYHHNHLNSYSKLPLKTFFFQVWDQNSLSLHDKHRWRKYHPQVQHSFGGARHWQQEVLQRMQSYPPKPGCCFWITCCELIYCLKWWERFSAWWGGGFHPFTCSEPLNHFRLGNATVLVAVVSRNWLQSVC